MSLFSISNNTSIPLFIDSNSDITFDKGTHKDCYTITLKNQFDWKTRYPVQVFEDVISSDYKRELTPILISQNNTLYTVIAESLESKITDSKINACFKKYLPMLGMLALLKTHQIQYLEEACIPPRYICTIIQTFSVFQTTIDNIPIRRAALIPFLSAINPYNVIKTKKSLYILTAILGEGGFKEVFQGIDLQRKKIVTIAKPVNYFETRKKTSANRFEIHSPFKTPSIPNECEDKKTENKKTENKTIEDKRNQALKLNENINYEFSILEFLKENKTPYIVHSFDLDQYVSEIGETSLLIEEYCSKGTLRKKLMSTTLLLSQILKIGFEIASCLTEMHKLNIVHRDIKASNILITDTPKGESIRVGDFGLAGKCSDDPARYGTPQYLPPELYSAKLTPSPSQDAYAFGCILFEMRYRKKFQTIEPNNQSPIRVNSSEFTMQDDLDKIILGLTEHDPQLRKSAAWARGEILALLMKPEK